MTVRSAGARGSLWGVTPDVAGVLRSTVGSRPPPTPNKGPTVSNLIPEAGIGGYLERYLLADGMSTRIGAIHRLDFDEAIVLTHDKWKFDAGGIPQFCFLLATARDISTDGHDDDEVLLLRVDGTAPLAMESDLLAVREESLRNALAESDDPSPAVALDMDLDPFTKNRVSYTGLRCKILGTFYEEDIDGQKHLQFGADVDNFYATSTYRVLKPTGAGLTTIASFLKPQPGRPVEQVRIGTVRYSATRRRAQASGQPEAPVEVNIHDFIGTKTGLIGMTRTGKSNTAKTLIARTFVISERERAAGRLPIGQLVFDPQGEYANDNPQDDSAIAAIGPDHVRIFQFGADGSRPHVRPLGINFFDPGQITAVQGMISDTLRKEGASGYVNDFAIAEFEDVPGDRSATTHAQRARLCLYGALCKAGFALPDKQAPPNERYDYSVVVNAAADLVAAVNATAGRTVMRQLRDGSPIYAVDGPDIQDCVQAIVDIRTDDNHPDQAAAENFCKDSRWQATEPIFSGHATSGNVRGWRNLLELRPFHDAATQRLPAQEIYEHLLDGRIVIVDLHVGTPSVIQSLSEAIARYLIGRQTQTFTSGVAADELPRVQVMLEEAHNLFSSERYRDDADVWVTMAKESAKLGLAMAYATQEVSGVAHQVKANTANWVVAHLNNTKEVRDLSQFYDFKAFGESIISSEDKGYVRLKTLSSPYIVPVQIDRYGIDLVNEARAAADEEPLVRLPSGKAVPQSQADAAAVAEPSGSPSANGSSPTTDSGDGQLSF